MVGTNPRASPNNAGAWNWHIQATVGIPAGYVQEVLKLLHNLGIQAENSLLYRNRNNSQTSLGTSPKAPHGFSTSYLTFALIAHALFENKCRLLESLREFQEIVFSFKTGSFNAPCKDQAMHVFFAMKQAAKLIHHSKYKYYINKTRLNSSMRSCTTSSQECQQQQHLETAALAARKDTLFHLDFGGT